MIDRGEELVRVAVSAAGHFLDHLIEGLPSLGLKCLTTTPLPPASKPRSARGGIL